MIASRLLLMAVLSALMTATTVVAFVPSSYVQQRASTSQQRQQQLALGVIDPSTVIDVSTSVSTVMDSVVTSDIPSMLQQSASSNILSFADQGQNLAGIFFQASLLPYLLFIYFLSFRGNRIPDVGNFGFQFVLLFVFFTIPSGIISKSVYGCSLADVDWLHGGAELLLTIANILIVWGFKEASTNTEKPNLSLGRTIGFASAIGFAAACALGPTLGFEAHSAFMFGLGDLSADTVASLPLSHAEPVNALSMPTWIIHFSSVIEYLIAMNLVWKFSEVTENEKWKGLTFGMLPLHASGVCACTYHFFYNPSALQFLVTMQAGFTLLGNLTCAIAAFRIAQSNGWSLGELNPFPKDEPSPQIVAADQLAASPLVLREAEESNLVLAAKVAGLTVFLSYLVKYGELALDIPFTPNSPLALAMVLGVPAVTAYSYLKESDDKEGEGGFNLSFGDNNLSMDDVKKFGVSGTVAYVLTELAFWVVAFPVAAFALYQSTGHWPDVINETGDRAAVLAFIFAGANVARAFVPLRLGAALALAPWVDENLLSKFGGDDDSTDVVEDVVGK